MHDAILFQFSRDLVEDGDATDLSKRFSRYLLPAGRQREAMMNHLAMFIEGYDDPRGATFSVVSLPRSANGVLYDTNSTWNDSGSE
jgi:hypothetical protein